MKARVSNGELVFAYEVVNAVAEAFDVSVSSLLSRSGTATVTGARHAVCWILHKHYQFKATHIASVVDRDHTTVLAAVQKCEIYQEYFMDYRERCLDALRILRTNQLAFLIGG